MLQLFKIRRDERLAALAVSLFFMGLNGLLIHKYYTWFTRGGHLGFWSIFYNHFLLSGFDPSGWLTLSTWNVHFNVYRHPLLALLLWPLAALNEWQMEYTRYNLAVFIMAALLVVAALYSFLFLWRILRERMGLGRNDALLLTTMFFSFAYVMTSMIAPDHFGLSLPLLLLVLYVAGHPQLPALRTSAWSLLCLLIAGITLTNGIKVWLAALHTEGRKLQHWRRVAMIVVLPAVLLTVACHIQNERFVKPHALAGQIQAARNAQKDTTLTARSEARRRLIDRQNGRPLSKRKFLNWTNVSLSRTQSVVENLLGESLQLHSDHLLEDIFCTRPIIVRYSWPVCYVVEVLLALLLAGGAWMGRRNRTMQLALLWLGVDLLLHVGLGFGLNEVYIMTCHWAFVIPLAAACAWQAVRCRWQRRALRILFVVLTLHLFLYNTWLLTQYLLA